MLFLIAAIKNTLFSPALQSAGQGLRLAAIPEKVQGQGERNQVYF